MELQLTQLAVFSVMHIAKHVTVAKKVDHFDKVCRSKGTRCNPHTMATQIPASTPTVNCLTISNIQKAPANEPASLIKVRVTSTNGSRKLEVLLDSGADISAAGTEVLQYLNKHTGSLYSSAITSKAVNGTKLHPLGKLPVKLHLDSCDF